MRTDKMTPDMTAEQREAVLNEQSMAVIASAGTGKTTVLTNRFVFLLTQKNVPLHNILAFTYTQKAANEMKQRILKVAGLPLSELPQLGVSTIHSFLTRILRRHGAQIGLSSDFVVLEEFAFTTWVSHEIRQIVSQAIAGGDPLLLDVLNKFDKNHLTKILTHLVRDAVPTSPQSEMLDFLNWCRAVQKQLLEKRVSQKTLSFGDLENLSLKLLDTCPEVRSTLVAQYQHILLDECQDTAPIQFKIINHLFAPGKNTIFAVGDPKQSIYGFRQADTNLFYQLTRTIENAGGKILYLTRTFRTPKKIQDHFNLIFPVLLNTDGQTVFEQAITELEDRGADFYTAPLPDPKDQTAMELLPGQVLQLVQNLLLSGVKPQSIAILSATRKLFKNLESLFTINNIPYVTDSRSGHFQEDLIALLFHVFLYLSGNREKITQAGILHNPLLGFEEEDISRILNADQQDLFDTVLEDAAAEFKVRHKRLSDRLTTLKFLGRYLAAPQLLKAVVQYLKPQFLNSTLTANELHLIQEFSLILESWQQQGYDTLNKIEPLLKEWEQSASEFRVPEQGQNGVNLLTIHRAKGLEFEHVIVIPGGKGNNNGPPFVQSEQHGLIFKQHDQERITTLKPRLDESSDYTPLKEEIKSREERETTRLIYVALTRTQKNIYLFPPKPAVEFYKKLSNRTLKPGDIKTYNNWLCWLATRQNIKPIAELELAASANTITNSPPSPPLPASAGGLAISTPITVTELETFATCPKKFELKHLWRIENPSPAPLLPARDGESNPFTARERGNFVHEVLQFYDPARDNLEPVVEQALFNQHLTDPEDKLLQMAKKLVRQIQKNQTLDRLLYHNSGVQNELAFTLAFQNHHINGQIDRLVNTGSQEKPHWQVVDYKTHTIRSDADRQRIASEYHLQMACYALAVHKAFAQNHLQTTLVFTHDGSHHDFKFTPDDFLNWEKKLEKIFSHITKAAQSGQFNFTTESSHCEHCPYFEHNACGVGGEDASTQLFSTHAFE